MNLKNVRLVRPCKKEKQSDDKINEMKKTRPSFICRSLSSSKSDENDEIMSLMSHE